MSFLKNFDWSLKSIAKVIGLALAGIVVLTIIISLLSFSFRTVFYGSGYEKSYYDTDYSMGGSAESMQAPAMSRSKISMPPTPEADYSTGDDAEDYEVVTYSATIKSRKLEQACKTIIDLKSGTDVIFETSNQNDDSCYFSFKVKKEKEKSVLQVIEGLKPDILNENIQTIKGSIEEYDKQLDILKKKLTSVEETLTSAQTSYDEIQKLATSKQDVESLATIISNKLSLIEKLTDERISIKEKIDTYNLNKADQMDRLNYSFFDVSVYKDKIFDWKDIKDSWKYELKAFVSNFNEVIQGISVQLITYMIRFIQVAIYFFLSVFLLKFVWMATKRIWKGKGK